MSVMVIACYKPKPGSDDALLALIKTHLPTLRAEGLVGDDAALCGRASDGTFVEVFCWKSQNAIDTAHSNKIVGAMWAKFAAVSDYTVISNVAGAADMFMSLTPVDLT